MGFVSDSIDRSHGQSYYSSGLFDKRFVQWGAMPTDSKREKRELILAKAREAFSRYGLRKTTMDDIAQGCGLRKAALYYYFDSKEAIIAAMMRQIGERLSLAMGRRVKKEKSAAGALKAFFHKDITDDAQEGMFMLRLAREDVFAILPLAEEAMMDMEERQMGLLRGIVKKGVEDGSFFVEDAEAAAEAIFSVIRDAQKAFLLDPTSMDNEEVEKKIERMQVVVELLRRGLQCPPAEADKG